MVKKLITEISEEDFRKLNLIVKRNERVSQTFEYVDKSLNEILDEEIAAIIRDGYESEMDWLELPVTIAIHEDGGYYLDKFMNRFTGAQTYQLGFGIKHLYSTRDYYECRDDDYWRVRKDETKVIYRVRLSEEWIKKFELKHKSELIDWPYETLPRGCDDVSNVRLRISYDNVNGKWVDVGRCAVVKNEYSTSYIPIDIDGKEIRK